MEELIYRINHQRSHKYRLCKDYSISHKDIINIGIFKKFVSYHSFNCVYGDRETSFNAYNLTLFKKSIGFIFFKIVLFFKSDISGLTNKSTSPLYWGTIVKYRYKLRIDDSVLIMTNKRICKKVSDVSLLKKVNLNNKDWKNFLIYSKRGNFDKKFFYGEFKQIIDVLNETYKRGFILSIFHNNIFLALPKHYYNSGCFNCFSYNKIQNKIDMILKELSFYNSIGIKIAQINN